MINKKIHKIYFLIFILIFIIFYFIFFKQKVTIVSEDKVTIEYKRKIIQLGVKDSIHIKVSPGKTLLKIGFDEISRTLDTTLQISWFPKKYRIILYHKKKQAITKKETKQRSKEKNLPAFHKKQTNKTKQKKKEEKEKSKTNKLKDNLSETKNSIENNKEQQKKDKSQSYYKTKKRKIEPHDSIKQMTFIQGGTFEMGRDNRKNREKPAHKVKIKSFYMDTYEVTVQEFLDFCKKTGHPKPKPPKYGWIDSLPITNVNWHDAIAYAKYHKKRLPTEAEWEYAARGGIYFKDYKFSGGNDINELGWYIINSIEKPNPVGKLRPNQLGLYDMSGNVWEWCFDWFSENYYEKSPANNPKGPDKEIRSKKGKRIKLKYKIIRGGSFADNDYDLWTTDRRRRSPSFFYHQIGFRCARDKHVK